MLADNSGAAMSNYRSYFDDNANGAVNVIDYSAFLLRYYVYPSGLSGPAVYPPRLVGRML